MAGCANSKSVKPIPGGISEVSSVEDRKDLLLGYGLCTCIHQYLRARGDTINDNSLETYVDLGEDDFIIRRAGERIDSMANVFIRRRMAMTGSTYEGREFPILHCIELFYKGQELSDFVERLIKENKD